MNKKQEAKEEPRIPEGYFKIGEYVEYLRVEGALSSKVEIGQVQIVNGEHHITSEKGFIIRRKPAWKPKDGEAVLFNDDGQTACGVFDKGQLLFGSDSLQARFRTMRPFDTTRIGKPWS